MPTEQFKRKIHRLLDEGAVTVSSFDKHYCVADVIGDHDTYRIVRHEGDDWSCTCEHMKYQQKQHCTHIEAVKRIWSALRRGIDYREQ